MSCGMCEDYAELNEPQLPQQNDIGWIIVALRYMLNDYIDFYSINKNVTRQPTKHTKLFPVYLYCNFSKSLVPNCHMHTHTHNASWPKELQEKK